MRKPPFFIAAAVILFCLSPVRATADSPIRPMEGRQAGRPVEDVQSIRPFQPSESPAQRAGRLLEGRDLTAEQAVLLRGLLLRDGALLDRLGEGLRASAWSESGFPEAADCPSRRIFTVQFHPERMAFAHRRADTVDGAALFRWFLSLCR